MRAHLRFSVCFAVLGLTVSAGAWAQAAVAAGAANPAVVRDAPTIDQNGKRVRVMTTEHAAAPSYRVTNERVRHIRLEDSGSRVDEMRVGGQTKTITVQPKAAVPAYDVQPVDVTRPALSESTPGSAGPRTWKVFSF